MLVKHFSCAPFVTASEEKAWRAVNKYFAGQPRDDLVSILTNLALGSDQGGQPLETDMIVIGPGGGIVIEVKHWDRTYLKSNKWTVDDQADLATRKAKQVASRLRRVEPDFGFVPAKLLLTKEGQSLAQNGRLPEYRSVVVHGLGDLAALLEPALGAQYGPDGVGRLAAALAPRAVAAATGQIRRIAHIAELKLLSPEAERFHRVYAGRDMRRGDRLTVHVYDLSAGEATNAETLARREFDAVQRLQKSSYLPSLVDSFQPVPGYPGELFFFTLEESAATAIGSAAGDPQWTVPSRLAFAAASLRALAQLQAPNGPAGEAVVHRGLTPERVRVRADGRPLFAGWQWARVPGAKTISGTQGAGVENPYTAPEVKRSGLVAADTRSDVYSLCKVLSDLFAGDEPEAKTARQQLAAGMADDPAARETPEALAGRLANVTAQAAAQAPPEVPAHWDEGHVFEWRGERYRVVSVLGEGGIGRTFKLEQLDGHTETPIGTFVGKVVPDPKIGPVVLDAYRKIRSIADHPSLSGVYQTATDWHPDTLLALLKWRRGEPIEGWRGNLRQLLELLAEEFDPASQGSPEGLLLRWAEQLCEALEVLHAQGWVHGDVSPSNILFDENEICLIDFDLACRVGSVPAAPGTTVYASPERLATRPVAASDDLFALAASIFHVLTDRLPFVFDGARRDGAGLAWRTGERESEPRLAAFLDRAVDPDPMRRFETAGAALRFLHAQVGGASPVLMTAGPETFTANVVPRVEEILSAYPGSRFGNLETRGLDSDFALDTYVETDLDRLLPAAIRSGQVSLVILCGNAGDGKTSFLQHLAAGLGVSRLPSQDRVWEGQIDGKWIKINLDGAAAWRGRSADELLDDLFVHFQQGAPAHPRVHLVAVNDGRLMEWIESYEKRHGETRLTGQLTAALAHEDSEIDPHIRFIELNLRSLAGRLNAAKGEISTEFVDGMIAKLVGGDKSHEIWAPCRTCSARTRCGMRVSAEMMGASEDTEVLAQGKLFRRRLALALQAVHQRGEVHITARELKAALSYFLFGIYRCEDLHADVTLAAHVPADFAFDPDSPRRQGPLLREMTLLDPALEANARIDRYLLGRGLPDPAHGAPRYPEAPLKSARRRAWFEWTDAQIKEVGGEVAALGLARSRHFHAFHDFPLLPGEPRRGIRDRICRGLSRLESLPEIAFHEEWALPIRVVPRTPTETAFWITKPLDRFTLEPEHFAASPGVDTLHRQLLLGYRSADGRGERLVISLELFGLLMDLADGAQILDAFSDDVFANLGVFTQRLAQEDERALSAWNPADEERIYRIGVEERDTGQTIVLQPSDRG